MWGWHKWSHVHGPVCSAGWNTAAYEATLGSLIPMWKGQSTSRLQNELLLSTQDPTDSLLGWGWNTGLKQRQRQYGRLEVGSQAEVRWEVGGGRMPKLQMQLYSLPRTRTRLLPPTSVCYCPPKRLQNVCHTQFSLTANWNTHLGSFYLTLLSSNCMEAWVMFWKTPFSQGTKVKFKSVLSRSGFEDLRTVTPAGGVIHALISYLEFQSTGSLLGVSYFIWFQVLSSSNAIPKTILDTWLKAYSEINS